MLRVRERVRGVVGARGEHGGCGHGGLALSKAPIWRLSRSCVDLLSLTQARVLMGEGRGGGGWGEVMKQTGEAEGQC